MRRTSTPASRRLALAAVLPLAAAACGRGPTEPGAGLAVARARWARSGPANYSLTLYRSCECTEAMSGPVVVTVRGGQVTARVYQRTGAPVTAAYAAVFPAVDGLFALVESGVRAGTRPAEVRYHPVLGYPTRVVFGDPATDAPVTEVTTFRAD
jgi:hypothetical protein